MPNIFLIVGEAWDFYKKQSVMNSIVFWLYALPIFIILILEQMAEKYPSISIFVFLQDKGIAKNTYVIFLLLLIELVLSIIILWGTACVLLVSKKLLKNKAGRTRSSFNTVKKQAGNYVANLFITEILRACITILWGFLFIIPGIIYAIRTFFFRIEIVCEEKEYRNALEQSTVVVRGKTWKALNFILGIAIIIYLPVIGITGILTASIYIFDERLLIPVYIVDGCLLGVATSLFTISTVILYRNLKKTIPTSATEISWLS